MTKAQAKKELEQLIEKFEALSDHERKDYNEANTRKDFILPMFRILGWDVYSKDEVNEEEKASGGRVDYSFSINGLKKFYVEAKAIKIDLDEKQWAEQAIDYAWHKSVPWAILSDFEGLKIFSAGWDVTDPEMCLFRDLHYQDYLEKFDDLWLLSKESIEKSELDKVALESGRRPKRTTIDKQLTADLLAWHDFLRRELIAFNKKLSRDKLEECIQRLLNRLIFIRTIEDRGIENKILQSLVREYERLERKNGYLADGLRKIFTDFNKNYDSKLFEPDIVDSEKFEIVEYALAEVIDNLYKTKAGIRYNFDQIPADILGSIYEQYLGNIQREGEAKDSKSKRKSQGIYYTPRYIVDYIVKNTVGEYIKNKSLNEVQKIKILDPACGSGSFLIRAFEELDNYLEKEKNQTQKDDFKDYLRKIQILSENIYGVDLDDEAVELTRLNLLLKTATRKHPLPDLAGNIKNGNSLISGSEAELKKYFGKEWENKKPFNWEEEYKDLFKQGGFDVVIGNPPYVRVDSLDIEDKNYWKTFLETSEGKYDLYYLFIERAVKLLKTGGILGFIIPNKWCVASSAKKLREFIFNNSVEIKVISVSKLPVFKDASNYPVLLIATKGKKSENVNVFSFNSEEDIHKNKFNGYHLKINELDSLPSKIIPINIGNEELKLTLKLIKGNKSLSDFIIISEGLRIPENFENKEKEKYGIVKQYQFDRYSSIKRGSYISEDKLKKIIKKEAKRFVNIMKKKIVIAEDALLLSATLDSSYNIPQGGVYFATLINDSVKLSYILALLNSKLLSFLYKVMYGGMHMGGGYLRFRSEFLEKLPIVEIPSKEQKVFEQLVDNILKLTNELQKIDPIMDKEKYEKKKKEIGDTDKVIDQLVYKLYGLSEEDKKVVEGE